MKILSGHVSPETAYVVDDYPYGFRLRCKIRYWMEHDPKWGTRFCSQTSNPKNATQGDRYPYWNKPKKSTYDYVAACMYLDEQEHVNWTGLTQYNSIQECEEWLNGNKGGQYFRQGLPPEVIKRVEDWIEKKTRYAMKMAQGASQTAAVIYAMTGNDKLAERIGDK